MHDISKLFKVIELNYANVKLYYPNFGTYIKQYLRRTLARHQYYAAKIKLPMQARQREKE